LYSNEPVEAVLLSAVDSAALVSAAELSEEDSDEDDEDEDDDDLSSPHPTNAVAEIASVATKANVLLSLFIGSFLLKCLLYFNYILN
jgi:hypothetical protein